MHNLYPTTPKTVVPAVTSNAATVTVLPDCAKGQLQLEIPSTGKWVCVADPTIVVAPAVEPSKPIVAPVVVQPTNPVVKPVSVDPRAVVAPINLELDPFVFNLKTQASYFSWFADPKVLYDYGQALCAAGVQNPFALVDPLTVPVPVGDGIHLLTPADVLLAITTAYTYGCPQTSSGNPEPVVPTLLEIANHMPVVGGVVAPVVPTVPVVAPVTPVAPVVPVSPVVNPVNDVVLTP